MALLETQLALLSKELELVDSAIRQLDDITKGVKNWAIVTWTGALGLTLATVQLHPFVWVTAMVPLLFWIVDSSYRRVQRSFILRSRTLSRHVNEQAFRDAVTNDTALPFELLLMREKGTNLKDRLLGVMLFRTVWLLYVGLAVISVMVWLVVPIAYKGAPPVFQTEATVGRWVAMWNTYDLAQVDSLFLADARLTYFSSEKEGLIQGIAAVREHHVGFGFVEGGKAQNNKLWVEELQTQSLGDAVVVEGVWYFRNESGDSTTTQKGPVTFVYALDEHEYRIAHVHFANY